MRTAENSDGSQKTDADHFPSMKITVRAHLELTKMLDLETCPKRWIPLMGFFIKASSDSAALSQPQLCSPRGVAAALSLRGLPLSLSPLLSLSSSLPLFCNTRRVSLCPRSFLHSSVIFCDVSVAFRWWEYLDFAPRIRTRERAGESGDSSLSGSCQTPGRAGQAWRPGE